jgi:alkanesulfonate monooxygenase SsuD/methylene tetrahydromethanopterin reductase-like flavin-dependent oxidoreductase (luciferase family)
MAPAVATRYLSAMARKHPNYVVDTYRQADERSRPTLVKRAPIVAHSDEEAIQEAQIVRAFRVKPTFFIVREVSRGGERTIHTSQPVFDDA